MRKKIVGVTVGTTINPKVLEKTLKPVKTVNGVEPDENGNVQVGGSAEAVQANLDAHTGNKKNPHDVTAEQIYAAPMEYTKKVGNPHNLLDNSDFRNPVNQRGQTSYTATGYTIDRWRANSAVSVMVTDHGIKIKKLDTEGTADFYQPFPNVNVLLGKTFTFAISTDKGVFLKTCTIPSAISGGEIPLFLNFTYGELRIQCINANYVLANIYARTEFTVYWAALYEGEYTAETLPEYQSKGYAVELAECQRYHREFTWLGGGTNFAPIRVMLPLPFPMRMANPTVTFEKIGGGGEVGISMSSNDAVDITVSGDYAVLRIKVDADL